MSKENLDLLIKDNKKLKVDYNKLEPIKEELDLFLQEEKFMHERAFARKAMTSQEVKSNNTVEGITDDLLLIEKVIKDATNIKDENQRRRIINLYEGYKFILRNRKMDKEHLKDLYKILSNNILEPNDDIRMGEYYRKDKVYILKKGRLDTELDEGIPYEEIDKYMDSYFNFINTNSENKTITEEFIKSQIMHYYFVYIHPYFDVNGRTSRTMSMWYLLNKKAFPYIIFNRSITFNSNTYDTSIIDTKKFNDITFFLRYMMENVKKELEKENILQQIRQSSHKLESIDYQTLIYMLTMKDEINVLNFCNMYNRYNDKKKPIEIYEEMILPLINKNILYVDKKTNKDMFKNFKNELLKFNKNNFIVDPNKIKRLDLSNK